MQIHADQDPFRSEQVERVDPDKVQISRHEYAKLLRDAEILDHVENGVDVWYSESGRRYGWEILPLGEWTEYGRAREHEGIGRTFREAAEDAFDLPELIPWHAPVPPRRPWKRYVLLGAALALGLHWLFSMQVPV